MPRTIQLRSGTWAWNVVEKDAEETAAGGPLSRTVVLRDTENPANRMLVRVPPHLGGPGDTAVVAAAAVHPERRFVQDRDGSVWAVWPIDHDPDVGRTFARNLVTPREVRARRGDGNGERGARAAVLPAGPGLGQLTGPELLELIR